MRKFIFCLIMALLCVGGIDAKTPRKTKSIKQTTTKTTTIKRKAPTPISAPVREVDVNRLSAWGKHWYEQALQGDARAQAQIGRYYNLGSDGFPEDKAEALRWFYLAAQNGHAESQYDIGYAYQNPYLYDDVVEKNYYEAARWYAKAAAQGHNQGISYLGMLKQYNHISDNEYQAVLKEAASATGKGVDTKLMELTSINGQWYQQSNRSTWRMYFYAGENKLTVEVYEKRKGTGWWPVSEGYYDKSAGVFKVKDNGFWGLGEEEIKYNGGNTLRYGSRSMTRKK